MSKHRPRSPTPKSRAVDGYVNPTARLGEASPLFSSATYARASITANPTLLTTLYRENWIAKRIIDMVAEDMTRAWYRLTPSLPPESMEALSRLESRHELRREITNAIRWSRLYGGACALIVLKGEENRLAEPLCLDDVMPGSFSGLLILDRTRDIEPSLELEEDLDDVDFGYPKYYDITVPGLSGRWNQANFAFHPGNAPGFSGGWNAASPSGNSPDFSGGWNAVSPSGNTPGLLPPFTTPGFSGVTRIRAHHSRIIRFVGRELPRSEEILENYWGASELEHIWEELQKRSATSANIAQLVFQANITTLKMSDFGETLALGTDAQRQRVLSAIEEQNRMRTSYGLQLLSTGDSYENHPYSFSGLSDVYENFMLDMAGAAGIPATRLFGRSPAGMNATGESDLRNYYEMIGQLQERHLRPALEKLLPILMMSLFGALPDRLDIEFRPLMPTDPRERAEITEKNVNIITRLYESGLLTAAEAHEKLKGLNY